MEPSEQYLDFVRAVDRALQHLYDPAELRRSPLGALLAIPAGAAPAVLRQALLDAIEALKPKGAVSAQGKAWRIYQVLFHRYVGQFSQADVAQTLGLSIRQMAREESRSSQVLADYLWNHYPVAGRGSAGAAAAGPGDAPPSREDELAWLQQSLPQEVIAVDKTLQAALQTVAPLAESLGVAIDAHLPATPAHVAGQSSALRQALLNALTAALRSVPGGRVTVQAEIAHKQVVIHIRPAPAAGTVQANIADAAESFQMVSRLLALMGGTLTVDPDDAQHSAGFSLSLPVAGQIQVLIVDDNADALELYRRYLANTQFLFGGSRDPQQTLALAESLKPQVIVLDVMLPGIDGWEVLQRLRADPLTRRIPVIVSSILPEESLALALGAAAYVRKPVSREDFLAALQRQTENPAPKSSA